MSKLVCVRTLVLDVDDTLFPEREYVRSGFAAAGNWVRQQYGVDGFYAEAWRRFESGSRARIFNDTLGAMGLLVADSTVHALVEVYREHQPVIALYPDAIAFLDWAKNDFLFAVITDGYARVQRRKLRALGLDKWAPYVVVTDELGPGFWKPHSKAFELVMERFGGAAESFLYVGDNPKKDFLAPKRLGWRTVRVRRAHGEHEDYVATTMEEAELTVTNLLALRDLLAPDSSGEAIEERH